MRTPEQEAVLRSILRLMEFWDIAPDELVPDFSQASNIHVPMVKATVLPSIKYRHPVSLDTWNGEGAQPDWLRKALTKEGYTVEELKCVAAQVSIPADESAI